MFRTIVWGLGVVIIAILLLPLILVFKVISFFRPDGELPKATAAVIRAVIPIVEKLAGIRFDPLSPGTRTASGTVAGKAENCESDSSGTRTARGTAAGKAENRESDSPGTRTAGGTVAGHEHCGGAAMFVGNHQSAFDALIPLIHLGEPKAVVMKKEISKVPFAGWMLRFFGCIFLDRASLKAQVACIGEMEAKLRAGKSLVVFPEGTRSRGPEMGEYKAGAFRAAIAAGVPVIPFAVDGSWHCWEEKRRIVPGSVKLSILPPVPTDGLTTKDAKELAARVQDLTQQELTRLRAEKGNPNA